MMLQTCGVNAKLRKNKDSGTSYLPDGKGGHKDFATQTIYRLLITSGDLVKLLKIGFNPKRLKINELNQPNRSANQFVKIEKVIDESRISDTYCFTEPLRHAGVFNGIITSQCSEIIEYSDAEETAVCNLASIALPAFYNTTTKTYDYEKLHDVTRTITYNLNRVIDINYYPTPKTERSNKRHRPIGLGVQGLSDVFMMMDIPFASDEAKMVNKMIFETIYHAALTESCAIAKVDGPYETFAGSPASKGQLQFDLWEKEPLADRYDWMTLKSDIMTYGIRNSLLLAPMPTASTSQILGYNECIEPITSNIYSRRTIAGEFIMANKYLMNDLIRLDLWNEKIKNSMVANHGSIQHIDAIPQDIKEKYKTVWEIPMRAVIDMAADRGAYICQSQSLNLWVEAPDYSTLTSMHFYAWSKGLKTGIYYLRRRGRHQAQQFTIEPEKKDLGEQSEEICEMCSA
jgi:ribonucleoside-diphosphate reductase alpha chain